MSLAPFEYRPANIKALVVSEEPMELQRSIDKCIHLGYSVKSVDSFESLSKVANTFFDLVLISRNLRTVGINYLVMNFKQSFHGRKHPLFLLIENQLPKDFIDQDALDTGLVNGVFWVGTQK